MRVKISNRGASDEELVEDLARVALELQSTTLTRAAYDENGRFSSSMVVRRLGSWAVACDRAGLNNGRPDLGHDHSVWMQNIFDLWLLSGRQPTYGDMRSPASRFSPEGYAKRYGTWTDALRAFQAWIDETGSPDEQSLSARPDAPDSRHRTGRSPNLRLRWSVLSRDRFTCLSCGRSPANDAGTVLHVDHIVPYSKGGETEEENLQTLCDRCNYGKGDTN